jgi:hypothetical protein
LAAVGAQNGHRQQADGEETMDAQKAKEQSRDEKRKRADLDRRYGKIGISAVAGALKHQPCKKPRQKDREIVPEDCD